MRGRNSRGDWTVTLYPQVGEGSAVWNGARGGGRDPAEPEPEPEDSAVRAARRARSKIRRYLVANKLRYMWVLTFRDPVYDHADAVRQVAAFVRRLTAEFPQVGPYLYAGEPHPDGHGWHVNLFLSRTVDWAKLGVVWAQGYVFVTDWAKRGPKGRSLRERVRAAAAYAAKYASKSLDELAAYGCRRGDGEHRYERAQGFEPRVIAVQAVSVADVRGRIPWWTGGAQVTERWLSDDPGWRGPPLLWMTWAPV